MPKKNTPTVYTKITLLLFSVKVNSLRLFAPTWLRFPSGFLLPCQQSRTKKSQ